MANNESGLKTGRSRESLFALADTDHTGSPPRFRKMVIGNSDIERDNRDDGELTWGGNDFFRQILDSLPYPLYVIDANDYTVLIANIAALRDFASDGNKCYTLTHKSNQPCSGAEHPCPLRRIKKTKKSFAVEHVHSDKTGNPRIVEVRGQPIFDDGGDVAQLIVSCIDITEYRQAEEKLKSKNVALTEILANIENEKKQMALQIQSNIDRIAMPILRILKEQLNPEQKQYISLIQNSFGNIASPFVGRLEKERSRLTQREIEICNMIKNDMTTKQIASILMTSPETVRVQRKSIRKKLGISGEKTNLKLILQEF